MGLHKNYKLSSYNDNEVKFNSVFKQFVSDLRISICWHRHLVFQIPEPAPKIIKWNLLMYSTVMNPFFSVLLKEQ